MSSFASSFGFNPGTTPGQRNQQNQQQNQRQQNQQYQAQRQSANQNKNPFDITNQEQTNNQRLSDAVNNVDIGEIIRQQLDRTDQINAQGDEDRMGAISGLEGQQAAINELIASFGNQAGPTEFQQFLQGGIQDRINNPATLNEQAINAATRSRAARGLQDLLGEQGRNFASRGLSQSGVSQGQDALARENALNEIIAGERDTAIAGSQFTEQSLQNSFGQGNTLAGILGQQAQGFGGLQASLTGQNAGLQQLIASLQAPNRQAPDFGGFAGLALDNRNAMQGAEQQRASLEILAQQLGLSDQAGYNAGYNSGNINMGIFNQQAAGHAEQNFLQQLLSGVS